MSSLTFDLHYDPFKNEKPYAPSFYQMLGKIVFLWGTCEHLFDLNLRMAFGIALHSGLTPRIETTFKGKVDLMRQILKGSEPLKPF